MKKRVDLKVGESTMIAGVQVTAIAGGMHHEGGARPVQRLTLEFEDVPPEAPAPAPAPGARPGRGSRA